MAGSITNSITLNRYAYANGNPVSNVDPFGLSPERGSQEQKITVEEVTIPDCYEAIMPNEETVYMPEYYVVDGAKWYTSADDVAYVFGMTYGNESINIKREMGAIIVQKKMYRFEEEWHPLMGIVKLHIDGQIQSMPDFFRSKETTLLYTYAAPSEEAYETAQVGQYKSIKTIESRKYGRIVAHIHTHGCYDERYENDAFSPEDKEFVRRRNVISYLVSNGGYLQKYDPATEQTALLPYDMPHDPEHPLWKYWSKES